MKKIALTHRPRFVGRFVELRHPCENSDIPRYYCIGVVISTCLGTFCATIEVETYRRAVDTD